MGAFIEKPIYAPRNYNLENTIKKALQEKNNKLLKLDYFFLTKIDYKNIYKIDTVDKLIYFSVLYGECDMETKKTEKINWKKVSNYCKGIDISVPNVWLDTNIKDQSISAWRGSRYSYTYVDRHFQYIPNNNKNANPKVYRYVTSKNNVTSKNYSEIKYKRIPELEWYYDITKPISCIWDPSAIIETIPLKL